MDVGKYIDSGPVAEIADDLPSVCLSSHQMAPTSIFIKDEKLRYRDWSLARITKIYPGDDKHVRAVDLICHGKKYSCSTHMLIPFLPAEADDDHSTHSHLYDVASASF